MDKIRCSIHGIVLLPWNGGSSGGKYHSRFSCPYCGEVQERTIDLNTGDRSIKKIREGETRIHYLHIDAEGNITIAACNDCGKQVFIEMKEKKNSSKSPYCPAHKKFIRSWEDISWIPLIHPRHSCIEIRGIIK